MSTYTLHEARFAVTARRLKCIAMEYRDTTAEAIAYDIRVSVLSSRYGIPPSVVSYIVGHATGGIVAIRSSTDEELEAASKAILDALQRECLRCLSHPASIY